MTTYNEMLKQYLCNKTIPPRTEGKVMEYDDEHPEKFGKAIIDGKFTARISGYSYYNTIGDKLHIGDKISFSVVNVNGVIEGVGICVVRKYNIFKSCCPGFIKSYDCKFPSINSQFDDSRISFETFSSLAQQYIAS